MYDIYFDPKDPHATVEEADDEQFWYIGESFNFDFADQIKSDYNPDEWVDDDFPVIVKESQRKSKGNGCTCAKCGEHYPYAEPNLSDGTFKCWSCRNY